MMTDPFHQQPVTNSFNNQQSRMQTSSNNQTSRHGPAYKAQSANQTNMQNPLTNNQSPHGTYQESVNPLPSHAHNEETDNDRDYTMFPVYSKGAALQFKLSETRKRQGRNFSFDTIMIEGANRINPNDIHDKRYDWKSKLSVQIMLNELPIVIAVFLGFAPSCQFMNHGQNNDKGFNFERQDTGMFASVFHKGGSKAVKIDWPTTLNIGHFMLAQYTTNFEGLSSETILRNINRMCQEMLRTNSFPEKNTQRKR